MPHRYEATTKILHIIGRAAFGFENLLLYGQRQHVNRLSGKLPGIEALNGRGYINDNERCGIPTNPLPRLRVILWPQKE